MKKTVLLTAVLCLLLAGCGGSRVDTGTPDTGTPDTGSATTDVTEQAAPACTVYPLPDTTMENLTDAILAVSLEKGDVYVDDTGKMQMDVTIYTYDLYDAMDITQLKVGDTIVRHDGEVEVTDLVCGETGNIIVNGGLEEGGFELVPGDGGIFYETGFDDAKNWYEVGEATVRVSVDFMGYDKAAPEKGEAMFYPGDFLVDGAVEYHFTPYNTTIRVEDGQVVELNRRYTP